MLLPDCTSLQRAWYRLPRLIGYIFNYNNYHTEHHLFPTVNASNLDKVHARIEPLLQHNENSYTEALANVFKRQS